MAFEGRTVSGILVKSLGTINYAVALLARKPDGNRRKPPRQASSCFRFISSFLRLSFFANARVRTRSSWIRLRGGGGGGVLPTLLPGKKRNKRQGFCIGLPAIAAAADYAVAHRLSFDVKHVRHEEYVNNANKTLFIARAAPSLFYHCFLRNLFIPFISRTFFLFFFLRALALKRDVSLPVLSCFRVPPPVYRESGIRSDSVSRTDI